MKLLIIDDDEAILSMLTKFFEKKGKEVVSTSEPSLAIDTVFQENPDLIIVDLKMGPPTGRDVIEKLQISGIEIPVVVMSGFLTYSIRSELKRLGVKKIISKPFKLEEFEKIVDLFPEVV